MQPTRRFLIGALGLLLTQVLASSQTTLHSLTVYGTWDVQSAGDVDGDGVADFVVGCPGTSQLYCNAGGGYVHVYSGRTGIELYGGPGPLGGTALDAFGWAVGGVGDTNGDGLSDFIVGAPLWSSTTGCGEGRAYICSGVDGSVLQTLVGPGSQTGSYQVFGRCVAGIGDVDGDSVPDVAVGSEYGVNSFGVQSGYVCIYSGFDGSVLHTLYGNWINERFGTCCAAAGDVNGDGIPDVLVGSPYGSYATGNGGVRIYSGSDGLLLKFVTGTQGSQAVVIGYGVASTGDVNGDGIPDFVTGAIPSFGSGGARVYSSASGALLYTVAAQPSIMTSGGSIPLPHPVAGAGDVDGDGVPDIITATSSGASIYSGVNGALLSSHPLPALCASVGAASDLNGDAHADFLCGATNAVGTVVDVVLSDCPVPTSYCSGKLNSVGCLPLVASSGVLSLSVGNDDFIAFSQNSLNHTNGMLLWSYSPNSVPFYGGTLCVGSPIARTGIQNSGGSPVGIDCTGSFSFHFSRAYVNAQSMPPGARIYCQYWSRDPGYSPPNNVSLTNGLSFTVCP